MNIRTPCPVCSAKTFPMSASQYGTNQTLKAVPYRYCWICDNIFKAKVLVYMEAMPGVDVVKP